jgi:hypothetical protein
MVDVVWVDDAKDWYLFEPLWFVAAGYFSARLLLLLRRVQCRAAEGAARNRRLLFFHWKR